MKIMVITFLLFSALIVHASSGTPSSDMNAVLSELADKDGKPIESLTVEEARLQPTPADAVKTLMEKQSKTTESNLSEVREIKLNGANGMIPARLYIPKGNGPFPVVVYFHGGGFVIADNNVYDATPRALAESTGYIFVAVEYRRAPEFKFPAAHDDAYQSYKWVVRNADSFNGDPKRVAVAGESAGANLAINTSIAARNDAFPMPKHQLLVYPVASTGMNTFSYKENMNSKPLNKAMMGWFFQNYMKSPSDSKDPRLNLLRANLHSLPDTTLITAEIDPLRSEGRHLAEALEVAGIKVDYQNYKGVTHEFFGMAPVVESARKAQKLAVHNLKFSLN